VCGTLLAQQAALELAYAYWKTGERAQAQSTLDRSSSCIRRAGAGLRALPQGHRALQRQLGILSSISRQDISERDQQASRDALPGVQATGRTVFPRSATAPDARVRMDYIVNALAQYELHVARYYYRRGAYVAAANRAQQQCASSNKRPSVEEALYILAQSYDKLGLGRSATPPTVC